MFSIMVLLLYVYNIRMYIYAISLLFIVKHLTGFMSLNLSRLSVLRNGGEGMCVCVGGWGGLLYW